MRYDSSRGDKKGEQMTTITLDNKIGADVIKAIKALLEDKPKELYSISDEDIPALDKAIEEFKKGEFSVYKSVDEMMKDLEC